MTFVLDIGGEGRYGYEKFDPRYDISEGLQRTAKAF